jgi:hypothetical protein
MPVGSRWGVRALSVLVAVGIAASSAPRPAAALAPLQVGYADDLFLGADADAWLNRAHQDGATIVRGLLNWSLVAPTRPADPTNPADPAYHWTIWDNFVLRAHQRGLSPLMVVVGAPTWAEAGGRDPRAGTGSWRPDAQAFGAFATAAARRYSGSFGGLPRVRYWQAWNEPNLGYTISPQWSGATPESPEIYRALLNAFYAGIKAVLPSDKVIAGATAPYGSPTPTPPGSGAIQPMTFWRQLLSQPTYFDIWDHHPYGLAGGPVVHAASPDDITIPDMGRLGRLVADAVRGGTALPAGRKQGWVGEISWDSSPPDPQGVPLAKQARFLEGSLYLLWRQHVSAVAWFQIGDSPPVPSFAATTQGGTYFANGAAKPSARAFRFPFAAYRRRLGVSAAWGIAPARGTVLVQRRVRGGWRTLARARAGRSRVFQRLVRVPAGAVLRAKRGSRTSLTWRVGFDG